MRFVVLVQLAIFVLAIVAICLNRRAIGRFYKPGLIYGAVVKALTVPLVIAITVYLDPVMVATWFGAESLPPQVMRVVMCIGIALGLLCLVIRAGWHVLVFTAGAGEWRRQHHPAYVLLDPERPVPVGLILLAVFVRSRSRCRESGDLHCLGR